MTNRINLDPLTGRSLTVEFGAEAEGHASAAEVTLYPGAESPSKVRVIGPRLMTPARQGITVPTTTYVRKVNQGCDVHMLDTPIVLVPGREYSMSFDPASSPALICTDDLGNQYTSNALGRIRNYDHKTRDIAQYVADYLAGKHTSQAKVFTDLVERQTKAYAKAMRDLATGEIGPNPSSPTPRPCQSKH